MSMHYAVLVIVPFPHPPAGPWLLLLLQAGASFLTLHPRTKRQVYQGLADWSLTARAKQLLRIPVIGNGDVISVAHAHSLLQQTGCDGVMIGRGAVQDPLIFHRIKMSFAEGEAPSTAWDEPELIERFLRQYATNSFAGSSVLGAKTEVGRFGQLKKVLKYLFSSHAGLWESCNTILRTQPSDMVSEELLELVCAEVRRHWRPHGPSQLMLINHMKTADTRMLQTAGS